MLKEQIRCGDTLTLLMGPKHGEHNFPPIQISFVAQSVSDQMQLLGTVAWLIEVLLGVKRVLRLILVPGTFFSEDLAMKFFLWLFFLFG